MSVVSESVSKSNATSNSHLRCCPALVSYITKAKGSLDACLDSQYLRGKSIPIAGYHRGRISPPLMLGIELQIIYLSNSV